MLPKYCSLCLILLMIQLIDWVPKQQILLSEQSEKPENIRCYQDIRNFSAADSTVSEVYYEVHMTRAVHTARNSNVDSVMSINIIHLLSFLFYLPKSLYVIEGSIGVPSIKKPTSSSSVCFCWELHLLNI